VPRGAGMAGPGRLAASDLSRRTHAANPGQFGKEPDVRENTVKSIWARGGVVVNGWLSIPSSFSAEVMAHQGFDSLVVDMQHGVVDYQTAVTMLQAISTTSVIPFARVPWNDPAHIMKILDAGAYGIICPMINSRKEAEQLVRTCKYAPRGYRSFGPVRASIYGGTDYAQHANDTLVVMPMIETKEAVENIDEILSTPGIDAVYVGPADLSLTLGCTPKLDQTEAPVVEALGKILAACKRHKVIPGLHNATSGYALKMVAQGWQFVTLASDSRFLAAKAAEEAAAVKQTVASGKLPAY
jgi:4-hydroxy-2-oxoheptanedioate aldolase